jgi:hypothetical protein
VTVPEIEQLKTRLAEFERDVQEVEDMFDRPFQRGRAIIAHYRSQLAALDGRVLQ